VAGRFVLISRVGEGTFAEVWTARDIEAAAPDDRVVLKVFRLSARSGDDWHPVRNEIAAARMMPAHPHVLLPRALLKARHADGHEAPCLVFAFVPAVNLAEWLDGLDPPPGRLDDRLAVMGGVLRALAHVHAHGVVHGDVSFGNVLVAGGPHAYLIDFGSARTGLSAPEPSPGGGPPGDDEGLQPINPPPYDSIPPGVDGYRRDIYAFATLASLALTGRHPLTDAWQTLRSGLWTGAPLPHATLPRRPIRDLGAWMRDDERLARLADLLDACVAAEPERRPSPAQTVLDRWRASVE
jgi:serine/threonine protein kinase